MKKIMLLLAVMSTCMCIAMAQTEKGKIVVSAKSNLNFSSIDGELHYGSRKVEAGRTTSFEFTPGVGYFVVDNLAVGLNIGLNFQKVNQARKDAENLTIIDREKSTTVSFLPGLTYFFPLNGQIKPFINAFAGYASSAHAYGDDQEDEENLSGWGYEGNGGVAIFLNDRISLNIGVGYAQTRMKFEANKDVQVIAGGFDAGIGFSIFF
ncbi:MAG TPA: OmpW family outer membrane protein [Sphingobacterium sp.]|nr:OmpW family outer membrane protein [Sphingobacterium sp.]